MFHLWSLRPSEGFSRSTDCGGSDRIRPLLATLFLGCMGFTILGGVFFFFAPAAFSAAGAICIALAFNSARSG
jgi:hypothetical protein